MACKAKGGCNGVKTKETKVTFTFTCTHTSLFHSIPLIKANTFLNLIRFIHTYNTVLLPCRFITSFFLPFILSSLDLTCVLLTSFSLLLFTHNHTSSFFSSLLDRAQPFLHSFPLTHWSRTSQLHPSFPLVLSTTSTHQPRTQLQ